MANGPGHFAFRHGGARRPRPDCLSSTVFSKRSSQTMWPSAPAACKGRLCSLRRKNFCAAVSGKANARTFRSCVWRSHKNFGRGAVAGGAVILLPASPRRIVGGSATGNCRAAGSAIVATPARIVCAGSFGSLPKSASDRCRPNRAAAGFVARNTRPPLFAPVPKLIFYMNTEHHPHTHDHLDHPGHFGDREQPLARDFHQRAFTVGVGEPWAAARQP